MARRLSWIALGLFTLAACGAATGPAMEDTGSRALLAATSAPTSSPVLPSVTPLLSPTPRPTATPVLPTDTPRPTATPAPPTDTPQPTATIAPTKVPTSRPVATKAPTSRPAATRPAPTKAPTVAPTQAAARIVILTVNKREEWVDLKNAGGAAQPLAGWVLVSEKGNQRCALAGTLEPGKTLRVWALAEDMGKSGYNCGFKSPIWNNSEADPAVLYDAQGREVARK